MASLMDPENQSIVEQQGQANTKGIIYKTTDLHANAKAQNC